MAVTYLGLSGSSFERSFLEIPNLHTIIHKTYKKIMGFLDEPIQKSEHGPTLFDCIIICKDGSSKTQYEFLSSKDRSTLEGRYEKGFYFNQFNIFDNLFDKRKKFGGELIEHALFLVFVEDLSLLAPLERVQLQRLLTALKYLFFIDHETFNEEELEFAQYEISNKTFELLKINAIKAYLSHFTDSRFTAIYCELMGIHSSDILLELQQAYERHKSNLNKVFALYESSKNKLYWVLKNKFHSSVLLDPHILDNPFDIQSNGFRFFPDFVTYKSFLNSSLETLEQITIYPKSDVSDLNTTGKKWLVEQVFASYSIFNTQTYYLAHSKFKANLNPEILKICFSSKFFIIKKLYESRCLGVELALATKALDLIYEELLGFPQEIIEQIHQLLNGEKSKKYQEQALKFIQDTKTLEHFVSDNQVYQGLPILTSNLNLVRNVFSFVDFLQIAQEHTETADTEQIKAFKQQLYYVDSDFSDFNVHTKLLNNDFYQRCKCKDLGLDQGKPERLTSFVFSSRLSNQHVVFYIKVNHIFDQFVFDICKTPSGSTVRNEEYLLAQELIKYLNNSNICISPRLSALQTA